MATVKTASVVEITSAVEPASAAEITMPTEVTMSKASVYANKTEARRDVRLVITAAVVAATAIVSTARR